MIVSIYDIQVCTETLNRIALVHSDKIHTFTVISFCEDEIWSASLGYLLGLPLFGKLKNSLQDLFFQDVQVSILIQKMSL